MYVLKGQSRGDCCSQLFIDQAVYSRNRSFRLPFSSKAGKSSRLLPTGRFHCKEMVRILPCNYHSDNEAFNLYYDVSDDVLSTLQLMESGNKEVVLNGGRKPYFGKIF